MPNHLSNSVAPILFITSFLLLLLTFLSPATVFNDVSLLKFSSDSTTPKAKRSVAYEQSFLPPSGSNKMLRAHVSWKRKVSNSTASAATTVSATNATLATSADSNSTTERVVINYGPMGSFVPGLKVLLFFPN